MLASAWAAVGGEPHETDRLSVTGPPTTLSSTFPVTAAGVAAVGSSLLAATAGTAAQVGLDTRQLAVALRSERFLRRDGAPPGAVFDPLSAFHRTADGWIRLHANYPWHRAAALRVLGTGVDEAPAAIATWRAVELETALHEAGGVAAAVRTHAAWRAETGEPPALVEHRILGPADPRPPRRPRILDLTRVIAGPVATRTLAVHGADVLRLDHPQRPEIPLQYWDTLPGKRSALLDLTDTATREGLLAGADVVVAGYRPGALDRFGLAPDALARRHPGLVVMTLSAWGGSGPWATRRGFDSLVQAACGIALAEGDPGALPAQVLDHATGYLGAAAVLLALRRQRRDGGTHHIRLTLAGTAAWLQDAGQAPGPPTRDAAGDAAGQAAERPAADPAVDPAPYLADVASPDGLLTLARPPGTLDGRELAWPAPAPAYGTAAPRWGNGAAADPPAVARWT